jgi:excisionase family DNA binding protein
MFATCGRPGTFLRCWHRQARRAAGGEFRRASCFRRKERKLHASRSGSVCRDQPCSALVHGDLPRFGVEAGALKETEMTGLITTLEVAEWLKVTSETVRNWHKRRGLPGFDLPNGEYRFDPDEVYAWLEQHRPAVNGHEPGA